MSEQGEKSKQASEQSKSSKAEYSGVNKQASGVQQSEWVNYRVSKQVAPFKLRHFQYLSS